MAPPLLSFKREEALSMLFLLYLYVFLVGICLGSFLNVVAWRVPRGESFTRGRSRCTACDHPLAARDLVPLVSFLALHGRCRYCGAAVSVRYPLTELLGGAMAVACCLRFGFSLLALAAFAALLLLLAVALADHDTMEIPNGFVLALIVPAIAFALLLPETGILNRVIGFAAISLPLLLMALVIPGSFGGGDIKLMAVCGFMLGWKQILFAAFCAILCGGAFGVYLLAGKKADRKSHFAFGPFLCFGVALSMFAGDVIIGWYLGLF